MKPEEKFYTTEDLCMALKVNKDTAQRMCREGRVRTKRVGHRFRISEKEWRRILREGVPMRKVVEDSETEESELNE